VVRVVIQGAAYLLRTEGCQNRELGRLCQNVGKVVESEAVYKAYRTEFMPTSVLTPWYITLDNTLGFLVFSTPCKHEPQIRLMPDAASEHREAGRHGMYGQALIAIKLTAALNIVEEGS